MTMATTTPIMTAVSIVEGSVDGAGERDTLMAID